MKTAQWLVIALTLTFGVAAIAYFVPRWDLFAVSSTQLNDFTLPPTLPPKQESATDPEPEAADKEKDFYDKNPFQFASGKDLPKAAAPKLLHSFGRMPLGGTGEFDFVIRNEGSAPLKIAKGPTQCKCTLAGLKLQEIPPGGETQVHLAWTPKEEGPFDQGAVIWTDDPQMPKIDFRVEGLMIPEIVIVPEAGWTFGSIAKGGAADLDGMVYSSVHENLEIVKVETSSPMLEITVDPMTPSHLESTEAKAGFTVRGKLKGGSAAGQIRETITLYTNLKEIPKIEYTVSAVSSGPMMIVGPDWYAGNHLLRMGPVEQKTGATRRLTLMLEPGEEPFQLVDVKCTPPFLDIEVKPEKVGKELARERYTLLITVPKNAGKGAFHPPAPGRIEAKTNHPSVEHFRLDVEFEVR